MNGIRDFAPGDTVGAYRIKRLLANGGEGKVWLATHRRKRKGKSACVKQWHKHCIDVFSPSSMEVEEQVLFALDHPAFPKIVDVGEHPACGPYITMERMQGMQLHTYWRRRGCRLDPMEILGIAERLADALAYLHGKGFAHNDVSPWNIIYCPCGAVSLIDFGCATSTLRKLAWPSGSVKLRFRFTPPETILTSLPSPAHDLYSLGITVLQLWGTKDSDGRPDDDIPFPILELVFAAILPHPVSDEDKWRVLREGTTRSESDELIAFALKTYNGYRNQTRIETIDEFLVHLRKARAALVKEYGIDDPYAVSQHPCDHERPIPLVHRTDVVVAEAET